MARHIKTVVNIFFLVASCWMILYTIYGQSSIGIYSRNYDDYNDIEEEPAELMELGRIPPKGGDARICKCPKVHKIPPESREVPVKRVMSVRDYSDSNSVIRILSWTQLWGSSTGPWYPEGTEIFDKCGFQVPLKCEYTHDRSQYDDVDAILFHSFFIKDLPEYRYPDQKWIFWEYESPRIVKIRRNLTDYSHLFNITSTYSQESDVPLPFLRKCVPIPGEHNVPGGPNKNYAAGKSRKVAWFVSHCQTPSKRELYVKALQKFIAVDVYGACGPHSCPPKNGTYCFKEVLEKNYKFYLAFENSLCRDYVTEKLWNIFDHHLNIIPVVLGAADYTNMLPRGTYIDIRDFQSPAHLAKYLKHLDAHDSEYNQYILRRNFHTCRYTTEYRHYYCGLCEYLHRKRGVTEIALDVAQDWGVDRRCRSARAFYKGVADDIMDEETGDSQEWSLS